MFFDFEPGRRAGRSSCTPGRASRDVPDQQRTPADLRERHAPAPPRGRLGRGDPRRDGANRRGGDARERRAARAGSAAQRRHRPDRCAADPRGSGRLGVLPLAAVRQGPGLSRLALDLRPCPAARPDGRIRRDGDGRRLVAAGADDGDARPREPRTDRLPRGVRAARTSARRSASSSIRRGADPSRRGAARAEQPASDRPGGAARAPAADAARQGRRLHRARRAARDSAQPWTTSMPPSRSMWSPTTGSARPRASPSIAGGSEAGLPLPPERSSP